MKNPISRAITISRCWRDLGKVKTTRVSELVDFAFSHTIAPIQIRSELEGLCEMIKRREPRTALEIGTARGGTLFLLCRLAAGNAKIISLDLPHGAFGGGYSPLRIPLYKRFARSGQSLHLLRADSHSAATLERVNKLLDGELLDYLFIDADHTYEGVKKDFEMYAPLVKPGGMVVFHDIAQNQLGCEVPRFWNEHKFRHPWSTVIIDPVESYGIGILEI